MPTSTNAPKRRRSLLAAIAVTVGLLLASGIGYRMVADYLARPTDHVPMSAEELNRLPLRIGGWVGRDVPMEEAIVKATDADAVINRTYSQEGGGQAVGFFMAYGVRARDLMPHRPEVCYPGSGWTLQDTETRELELLDGSKLPCRVYTFSRTGLGAQAITVLNYYIVDGQFAPDVSLLRSRAWRGSGGVRYVAQVQITCSGSADLDASSAERAVRAFAGDSASAIRALLPGASQEAAESASPAAQSSGGAS